MNKKNLYTIQDADNLGIEEVIKLYKDYINHKFFPIYLTGKICSKVQKEFIFIQIKEKKY